MPIVVDADSHWTFPWEFDLRDSPLKHWAPKLPQMEGMLSFFAAGDLMASVPADERPNPADLFPTMEMANGMSSPIPPHYSHLRTRIHAGERVNWMDRIGIDYAIVNSAGFVAAYPLMDDLRDRQDYCRECNDMLADDIGEHNHRLGAVSYVDLTDLDWAVAELYRMRARGSRALAIRAEPVGGRSLAHPHFDRLWGAVVDAGMIVNVHVGLAPAAFGDWGRFGCDASTGRGRGAFLRMANSQRHQCAELFLNAMLFGGALQRNPGLTLLIAELHAFWLPPLVQGVASLTHPHSAVMLGQWEYPHSGDYYLRNQVRVSPLPGLGDGDALEVLRQLPEMLVFCSDFPHSEGNADPIRLYGDELATMQPNIRNNFMGLNLAKAFERVKDPLQPRPKAAMN